MHREAEVVSTFCNVRTAIVLVVKPLLRAFPRQQNYHIFIISFFSTPRLGRANFCWFLGLVPRPPARSNPRITISEIILHHERMHCKHSCGQKAVITLRNHVLGITLKILFLNLVKTWRVGSHRKGDMFYHGWPKNAFLMDTSVLWTGL